MRESIFKELVNKYFSQIAGKVTENENGEKAPVLLHKTMLTTEYSPDMKWESTSINHSVAAAHVVSLSSSLPLNQRSTMGVATGKLPKMGGKYLKNEDDITLINIMRARGANEATIASKIFDDVITAAKSVDLRNEIMFLQGLSSGQILVTDADNTQGTGIRVDFGFKEANKLKAKKAWGTTGATPLSDIASVFELALSKSRTIGHVWIDRKTFNQLRSSDEGKVLAGAYSGHVITDKTLLPTPSRNTFLEALKDEFEAEWHVISSAIQVENVDGTKKAVNAWTEGNIVFTPTDKVGRLVYGTLAEETNPVAGVIYQKVCEYTLISKYSLTDPVEEYTAAQARCLPVIDGADEIFMLTQK